MRPSKVDIQSGQASWDADVSDNFRIILDGPFPIFRDTTARTIAGAEAAYPPGDYDHCIYAQNLNDGALVGYYILFSDGTNWKVIPKSTANIANIVGAPTETDHNDLLAALRTAGVLVP